MKYAILIFTLLVSLSAFTSNSNKQEQTTAKNPPTAKPQEEPTALDDLIRGELAAMKAYDVALKDVKDPKVKEKLKSIRNEHEKAASLLSKHVASKPELLEDTKEAGPWGQFAKTWTKARSATGDQGALKALHDGEEHGLDEYKDALDDESISAKLKETIKTKMIPNQKKHMETLNQII